MISHDHKCIFTHVPKTAGKSVRALFGLPEFERDYRPAGETIEGAFGLSHRRLVELEPEDYFKPYFKFAFVRNPFDRAVSAFSYLTNGGCNDGDRTFRDVHLAIYDGNFAAFAEDISKFLTSLHFKPQVDWLCDDDRTILPDFVGRYESLDRDAAIIAERLGLMLRKLPYFNRSAHAAYLSYYDDRGTIRRIAEAYGEDFEVFRYSLS